MNIEDMAIEKNSEIENHIKKLGDKLNVSSDFIDFFSENGVAFVIEPRVMNIVHNREEPMSFKPGNVFLDLRKSLGAAVGIVSGLKKPENVLGAIQLVLLIILKIKDAMDVKLPDGSAEVIIALFMNNGFDTYIEENELYIKVNDYNKRNRYPIIEKDKYFEINSFLDRYGVIEIKNGKVRLIEKVFGKDFI